MEVLEWAKIKVNIKKKYTSQEENQRLQDTSREEIYRARNLYSKKSIQQEIYTARNLYSKKPIQQEIYVARNLYTKKSIQ